MWRPGGTARTQLLVGIGGGRLQRRGLRPQRIDHGLRNVFSAARIVVDRLNGVNRSPRDAPPTGNQRQQREREALYHWVFTLPEKVNIGRPPEREDDDGDAVLEKDELRPSLNLERSEEHTSELQSQSNLVCRLLLEKKKKQ